MAMIKTSAILFAAALSAAPSMSLAASSSCSVGLSNGFCHTGNVPAHPDFHFIHVDITGPCELFSVVDRANYITVLQGSSGWGGFESTTGGLYSAYSVYVYGGVWPITSVIINN